VEQGSSEQGVVTNRATVERRGERELVATRRFDAPPHLVFKAWTTPELFMRWWAPRSMGMNLRACDMDVRTGGGYRLEFGQDAESSMAFFGKYLEVDPPSRLVWTNEEGDEGAVTTITFEEQGGGTLLTYRDVFPTKEALEESMGAMAALDEQYAQLDEVLASLR
jgi:uncharacterized protein YndB with AHSA1/START domain